MSFDYLNIASDWGERKDVPVEFFRDEQGTWFARLRFKDRAGWFPRIVMATALDRVTDKDESGKRRSRRETREEYVARVEKGLERACVDARRVRIMKLTKIDPRTPPLGLPGGGGRPQHHGPAIALTD